MEIKCRFTTAKLSKLARYLIFASTAKSNRLLTISCFYRAILRPTIVIALVPMFATQLQAAAKHDRLPPATDPLAQKESIYDRRCTALNMQKFNSYKIYQLEQIAKSLSDWDVETIIIKSAWDKPTRYISACGARNVSFFPDNFEKKCTQSWIYHKDQDPALFATVANVLQNTTGALLVPDPADVHWKLEFHKKNSSVVSVYAGSDVIALIGVNGKIKYIENKQSKLWSEMLNEIQQSASTSGHTQGP